MKKTSLMLAAAAGLGLMLAGCDMQIRDKYVSPAGTPTYIATATGTLTSDSQVYDLYLGVDTTTMTLTSVTVNGTSKYSGSKTITSATWNELTAWDANAADLSGDFTVIYKFTVTKGTSQWNQWNVCLCQNGVTTPTADTTWYCRADGFSVNTLKDFATVTYVWPAGGTVSFDYTNHAVTIAVKKTVNTIKVISFVDTADAAVTAYLDNN